MEFYCHLCPHHQKLVAFRLCMILTSHTISIQEIRHVNFCLQNNCSPELLNGFSFTLDISSLEFHTYQLTKLSGNSVCTPFFFYLVLV